MEISKEMKKKWVAENGPFKENCYADPENNKEHFYWGCCCMCRHQIELGKHPWNSGIFKGKISDIFLWACAVFHAIDNNYTGYVSDREHGCCEMFAMREQTTKESLRCKGVDNG